jgi:hypothetical protein
MDNKIREVEDKVIGIEFKVFGLLFLFGGIALAVAYLFLNIITASQKFHQFQQGLGVSFTAAAVIGAVAYWFIALTVIGITRTVFAFFRDPVSVVLSPPEQKAVEFMLKERDSLSDLLQRDLSFSQPQFLDMAVIAFFKTHEALVNRDIDVAAAFIGTEVYHRLELRINRLNYQHQLFSIENLKVKKAEIHHYFHTADQGGADHIIARIEASAVINIVSEPDRAVVEGRAGQREFVEYYLFTRSDRTVTPYRPTEYVSRHCNNCGAPLDLEKLGECSFCGSKTTESTLVAAGPAESWTLLKPAERRKSADAFRKKCPNCGAELPYGNIKKCAHCGSVLVSGKFTWTLQDIMDRCFIIPDQPFKPTFDYQFLPH